jgi:hypothetical protein
MPVKRIPGSKCARCSLRGPIKGCQDYCWDFPSCLELSKEEAKIRELNK